MQVIEFLYERKVSVLLFLTANIFIFFRQKTCLSGLLSLSTTASLFVWNLWKIGALGQLRAGDQKEKIVQVVLREPPWRSRI